MTVEKTVTLNLDTITVKVKIDENLSDRDILKLAKEEALKGISKKFPSVTYTIANGNVLSLEECRIGMPVYLTDYDENGIIIDIKTKNKFPIKIAVTGGRVLSVTPTAVEKVNKRTKIDKLVWGRQQYIKEMNMWGEGLTGYFVNNGEIIPVVFAKEKKGTYLAIIITHEPKGSLYKLPERVLNQVFDTRKEAEEFLDNKR